MTQLSRPFQIVLVAFALFVAVWFLALRAHNTSTTGGSGSSASVASAPSQPKPAPATPTAAKAKVSATAAHAPGSSAAGSKSSPKPSAAAPAHGSKSSAHATSGVVVVKHSTTTASTHRTVVHSTVVVKHTPPAKTAPTAAKSAPSQAKSKPATGAPSMQLAVEHELQQGKTVLILFWNPSGADDEVVHREIPAVQHALGGKIAVHYASAGQVGDYGTITHAVQVTQTPTLLIVNPHGQATVVTGLADAFSIEQSVSESRA